jgi:hypothetical protein
MSEELWTFNGIDARTGGYLLQVPPSVLVAAAQGEPIDAKSLSELKYRHDSAAQNHFGVKEGIDVRALDETGWGVIFPAVAPGTDEAKAQAAVLEALRPLLDHRKAQATRKHGHYYKEYAGADGCRPNETKLKFLARMGAGPGPADPNKVPYYLLIVGDPRAISFRFQSQLGVQYAVGRLWFPTVEEYAHYARSVVAAETRKLNLPRRLHFFGATNADDAATQASTTHLVTPLADLLAADPQVAGWTIERTIGAPSTRQAFSDLLHGDAPALLFTASHGMGFPKDDPLQLRHQGALLLQDWPGPGEWREPIPERFYFAGDHLSADADLHGTIAFLFACYGAGTPELDEFSKQARRKRGAIASHPFIAGLPTAMLSRPKGGALAVIGHVERAWGHSFMWAGSGEKGKVGRQTTVFESALKSLMSGMPIGAAMEYFDERYAELASDLSVMLEEVEHGTITAGPELANLWTANNDARGYAILGDPAVCVQAREGAPVARVMASAARAPELVTAAQGEATNAAITEVAAVAAPTGAENIEVASAVPTGAESFGLFSRFRDDDEPADAAAPAAPSQPGVVDSLKDFVGKLGRTISGALEDMTSLEVQTYSASDMKSIFVEEGHLLGAQLRAYTRISLDGDTIVCVPERDGEIDKAMLEIHQAAVKQAQDARAELMRTIVQAATSLFGLTK